jgi:nitrate reductase NapE component
LGARCHPLTKKVVGENWRNVMKKIVVVAVALVAVASAAFAGGMAEPIMEMSPVVIEEAAAGSSGMGMLIPLILIALIAMALMPSASV